MRQFFRLILFSLCLINFNAFSQNLDVHFNAFNFIDNREYKAFVPRSHTYFASRTALDFGINLDSVNHFRLGVNAIHEFGAQPFFLKVNPVIYYNYQQKGWLFNIGAFPRKGLTDDYPIALLNDTLNYYRPNVEGMLARFKNNFFHETVWIDWVSRQTATDRENFIFGLSGKYTPDSQKSFFVSHYFMMLHDAFASVKVPGDHVKDNGGAQLRLGLDLSRKTALDSLTLEAGGMLSLERTRGTEGGFNTPKGFVANLFMAYKRFSFNDSFYAGQGHHIVYGDAFYSKKLYNRIDLGWTPFIFNRISGKFVFSFHQSPGQLGDSQQAFFLIYDLGRKNILKFRD